MKTIKTTILLIAAVLVVSGVDRVAGAASTPGEKPPVMTREDRQNPSGNATLRISALVKTHTKRYHAVESTTRGTDAYTMEIRIGGQTFRVPTTTRDDMSKQADRRHPEEGRGVRYEFAGNFEVPAGLHTITVSLPEEGVAASQEVTLLPGTTTLVAEPVYRKLPRNRIFGFRGERHFSQHIESLELSVQ